jgi:glycosyltransferase involved in cell wall biosynthesis
MGSSAVTMRVGIVHDWLVVAGGAERVLESMLDRVPDAVVRTLIYAPAHFTRSRIADADIRTSFLDRLPGSARQHRLLLPLMPIAIEQFDLSAEEVVISNSFAVAHGVITSARQLHIVYVNRTMTYAWDTYHRDLAAFGVRHGAKGLAARLVYHYVRQWDYLAFQRPDVLVCNSEFSRRRVAKQYRRDALVIHPPVDRLSSEARTRSDHYVFVGRLVPVKRVDLLIRAFNQLGRPLVIVGDGPSRATLEATAKANIQFVGWQPREVVSEYVASARAFVFASEEDFGVAPVEAQMLGVPVVAFGGGGTAETIVPGITGLLYPKQRVEDIVSAVQTFELRERQFDADAIAEHASAFSNERFQREFFNLVEIEWERFRSSSVPGFSSSAR